MQALCSIASNIPYAAGMRTGRPSDRPRTPFGERLYQLREEAGLTQAQVAEKLGISHREQLTILADLFGVSADFLIGRDAPKPRGGGPTGKLRQVFDNASKLSRRQQQRIIEVVEDMLVARGVNGHSNGS